MFIQFFYQLRDCGIPVSPTAFLTLQRALATGLIHSLDAFYTAARAILVKSERYFDLYDQVFAHHFEGADLPDPEEFELDEIARMLLHEWLKDSRTLAEALDVEEFELAGMTPDELIRLLRDQSAPNGIALRPEVLAFVVETLPIFVDDDAECDAVDARDNAAVELRRPPVDGDRMALLRIADLLGAAVEQNAKHPPEVVWCAADDEVVGDVSPVLPEPSDVGLKSASSGDQALGTDLVCRSVVRYACRDEMPVIDDEILYLGFVQDFGAEALCGPVVGVDQRPAAAEKEGVGAPEM